MFELFRRRPPEQTAEQAPTPKQEQAPALSRREFLKKTGKTTAGIAIGSALGGGVAAGLDIVRSASGGEGASERAVHSFKELTDALKEARAAHPEIAAIYEKTPDARTLEEQDTLRAWFDTQYTYEQLTPLLEHFFSEKEAHSFRSLSDVLQAYDAHGYIYRYAQEHPREKKAAFKKFAFADTDYYSIRVADALPTAGELRAKDIDPRAWVNQLELAPDSFLEGADADLIRNSMATHEGWLAEDRFQEVRSYFARSAEGKKIRALLQSVPDLTLAEALSTVKAAILDRQRHTEKTQVQAVQEMLDRRALFLDTTLVSAQTDTILYIYDQDIGGDEASFIETMASHGVPKERITAMNTAVYDSQEPRNHAQQLRDTIIPDSIGKTVIYFQVHGNEQGFAVDHVQEGLDMTYATLAEALYKRLAHSGDVTNLKDVTILADACDSYAMAETLRRSLAHIFSEQGHDTFPNVRFEDIAFPTCITSVHEGARGHKKKSFLRELLYNTPKDGPITGAVITRRWQPHLYTFSDLTVFQSDTGRSLEIGHADTTQTTHIV